MHPETQYRNLVEGELSFNSLDVKDLSTCLIYRGHETVCLLVNVLVVLTSSQKSKTSPYKIPDKEMNGTFNTRTSGP